MPSHQPLIADFRGNVIIAMAVGSLAIGFGTIRRMMRSVTNSDGVRGRIMNLSASDHVGSVEYLILLAALALNVSGLSLVLNSAQLTRQASHSRIVSAALSASLRNLPPI